MGPARSQPTEAEWLEHKAIIRRLYLIEEMPLKKLVAELGGLGLVVSFVLTCFIRGNQTDQFL